MSDAIDNWDLAQLAAAAHPDDELAAKAEVMGYHRQRFNAALGEDGGDDIMVGDDAATTLAVSDFLSKAIKAAGEITQQQLDKKAAAKAGGKATTKKDDETTSKPSKPEKQAIAPPPGKPWYVAHPWLAVGGGILGAGILGLAIAGLVGRRRK